MGCRICRSTKAPLQWHNDDACGGFHLFESGKHAAQRQGQLPPPSRLIAQALLSLHRAPNLASRGLSTGRSAHPQPANRSRCHTGLFSGSDMLLPVSSARRSYSFKTPCRAGQRYLCGARPAPFNMMVLTAGSFKAIISVWLESTCTATTDSAAVLANTRGSAIRRPIAWPKNGGMLDVRPRPDSNPPL